MKKKNIVIIYTDQQRFDSLGCNGNTNAKTPNLDAMAEEGCNFKRHISANSVCMPSRASFMTGMYVPGHGVAVNGIPLWRKNTDCEDPHGDMLPTKVADKIPTMADYLGDAGYQTCLIGKLHLEPSLADKSYGFRSCYHKWTEPETENIKDPYYGFQYVLNVLGHGEAPAKYDHGHYGRWFQKNYPELAEKVLAHNTEVHKVRPNRGIFVSMIPSELHNSTWIANEACKYIDNHKDNEKPMFMFVGFPDPHHDFTPPYDVAKDFMDIPLPEFSSLDKIEGGKAENIMQYYRTQQRTPEEIEEAYKYTQASVSLVDRSVGTIIDKLKAEGLYDDTVIVFTSDHGEMLGDFGTLYKANHPVEALIHTCCLVKPQKGFEVPKVVNTAMSNVDVLPTIFSMVGVDIPEKAQGVDMFTNAAGNMPMATCFGGSQTGNNISIFDDTYRYTLVISTGEEELYNTIEDPREYINLASRPEYRERCDRMKFQVMQKHLQCEDHTHGMYSWW